MLELEWPLALLLLPLPLAAARLLAPAPRQDAALRVPFYGLAAGLTSQVRSGQRQQRLQRLAAALAWLALVLATARPQWVDEPMALPASGRDLMLAVDASGSMSQTDLELNDEPATRLDVVKQVVGDFVERRTGDRLGLILFGTQPYLQVPLTFDRRAVNTQLQEAMIGIAGDQTAIGDALGLTVKRLRERPRHSRVLILLTDGRNTAGELAPDQAAELARQEGIRVYTVGVGAEQQIVRGFLFNRVSKPSDLDEPTLTRIAETTGGRYYRARNQQELEQIYQDLDRLEPIDQEAELFRPVKALYHWPLALALLLSFALAFHKGRLGARLRAWAGSFAPGRRRSGGTR